jgi:GTPase SAR1 family protein
VSFVLVGKKCDLKKERQVVRADAQAIADKYEAKVVETSAVAKLGFMRCSWKWQDCGMKGRKKLKK